MSTIKNFLDNIRNSIFAGDENYQRLELPPVTKVWQDDNDSNVDLSEAGLLEQFCCNLEKISGEFILCNDFNDVVLQIAKILRENNEQNFDEVKIMISSNSKTRQIADQLQQQELIETKPCLKFYFDLVGCELDLAELASCDLGLVSAEALLADTGSGVFRADSRFERLAVYLPPISVVIAERGKLAKNLQTAWQNLCTEIKNQKTGEFVIVTGPSRTADIEKVLILGVHGPRRLLFLIY